MNGLCGAFCRVKWPAWDFLGRGFGLDGYVGPGMERLLEGLRREVEAIRGKDVSENTRSTYDVGLRRYQEIVSGVLGLEAMPIDVEKMELFLVYMKRQGRAYNTLCGYVRSFSYYFRSHGLDVLTQDMRFKVFMSGVRREMTIDKGACPYAKAPFEIEWFDRMAMILPLTDLCNRKMMFWTTLCFHGFLRISELMGLRRRDIRVDEKRGCMELFIQRSKTDQFGVGDKTYIFKAEGASSPWAYKDVLECMEQDDLIVGNMKQDKLRVWLGRILQDIGVQDVGSYSFHSFRRGGAHLASVNGLSDSTIKAHGRWKSEAYLRYVAVDRQWAGQQVAGALVGGRVAPQ